MSTPSGNAIEVIGTSTWTNGSNGLGNLTSPIDINTKLVFKAGANVTINNMDLRFGPLATVIVEKGARLTLNGTVFSAAGACMWSGVRVQGGPSALYGANNPNPGRLFMMGNSEVNDAIIGVANTVLNDFNYQCNFSDLRYGVRINAINSFSSMGCGYTNCNVGESIFHFTNNLTIQFSLQSNKYFNCRIGTQVQGADGRIKNCTFADFNSNLSDIGCFTSASDIDITYNTFNNLLVGLISQSNDADNAKINNNLFDNCSIGDLISGENNSIQWACNTYNNNLLAWVLTKIGNELFAMSNQGDCSDEITSYNITPGNEFNNSVLLDIGDLNNPNDYIYYYDSAFPASAPNCNDPDIVVSCITSVHAPCDHTRIITDYEIINMPESKKKNALISEKIKYYVSLGQIESAHTFLIAVNNAFSKRKLVELKYERNDPHLVDSHITTLTTEREEDEYFKTFYTNINNAAKRPNKIFDINNEEMVELERIAVGYSQTSFKARSLMQLITGRAYRIPFPELPAEYGLSAENWHTYFKQDETVDQMPNVSIRHLINEDELHIYFSSADHNKYDISVVSILGQVMSAHSYTNYDGHNSISLSNLPSGIYLISLYKDQKPGYISKFIK